MTSIPDAYWTAVHAAVDREDPEGLLASGAPADEYDPEVDDLAALVRGGAVTAQQVRAIWERWFGPDNGLRRSPDAAQRLTAALADLATP